MKTSFLSNQKLYQCELFLRICIYDVVIAQSRSRGSRLNIIIVAEGATDRQGQHITSSFVKDVSMAGSQTNRGEPEAGAAGVVLSV